MHLRRIDKRLWNRVFFIRMDKNKLPRRKSLNIYDIAKEAGVSISTVSRVLNKKSNVREDTKQRVEAVLEKHSYRPSAIARGLVSSSMRTVAVLKPSGEYNDETDLIFYKEPKQSGAVLLKKGDFAIVPPEDAHAPRRMSANGPCRVKKIVVKVKV